MRIGLIDGDGGKYPNLPLMKLSAYHKARGDEVEFVFPLCYYDRIYISKVFGDEYTRLQDLYYQTAEIVHGGTGYAITVENGKEVYRKPLDKELPPEIEHIYPDYSLYPELTADTAYGFLTRGCPNNCGFCIVSQKEGLKSLKVADLSEFWSGQKFIKLLDPNLLACRDRKGVFLTITNKDLPVKRNKSERKYNKVRAARAPKGDSIEKRPAEIAERCSFGHWEMDCVVGKKGTKKTFLVLTERYTRYELIRIMKDHTAASVVKALDGIERAYGAGLFAKVFQTITIDNGSEFSDYEGLEQSCRKKGARTKVYYCHPYSSYERGSNENQNKMIRRHYPKGVSLDKVTPADTRKLEKWINNYPRGIFDYYTSADLYEACINSLISA